MKIIYGPFRSRRLGLSLGVNILPWIKSCTFNCVYCEIGNTPLEGFKSINKNIMIPKDFLKILEQELTTILKNEYNLDSITIGYNGEPTLVKKLDIIIDQIKSTKDEFESNVPISIFTNSSTIMLDDVSLKLSEVDNVIAKLDCADQSSFIKVNKPHPSVPKVSQIIAGLKNYKSKYSHNNLILQTLLINGEMSNSNTNNIDALAYAYNEIHPDKIHIYTISRPPASSIVRVLNQEKLNKVKNQLFQKIDPNLKEKIEVFPYRK